MGRSVFDRHRTSLGDRRHLKLRAGPGHGTLLVPGSLPATSTLQPILQPVDSLNLTDPDPARALTLVEAIGLPTMEREFDGNRSQSVIDAGSTFATFIDAAGEAHRYGVYALCCDNEAVPTPEAHPEPERTYLTVRRRPRPFGDRHHPRTAAYSIHCTRARPKREISCHPAVAPTRRPSRIRDRWVLRHPMPCP